MAALLIGLASVLLARAAAPDPLLVTEETALLAMAAVESTETFSEIPAGTTLGFGTVEVDGVFYSHVTPGPAPWLVTSSFTCCAKVLISNRVGENVLSFGEGNATTAIGFELFSPGQLNATSVEITATNTSGEQFIGTFTFAGSIYVGFLDELGIDTVVVRDLPVGGFTTRNHAFDNVSRAAIMVAPEPPAPLAIGIDIMPGSDLNPVNPMSRGVIPVVLLGSEEIDLRDVDPATLAFGPGAAAPAHKKGAHFQRGKGHAFDELLSHYRTEESGIAFGDIEACVTGELFDGTPFEGCDSIRTVPACGIGFELALLLPPLMWRQRRRLD